MKKANSKEQKTPPPIRKGRAPKPENHWVIMVKGNEPFYFQGNEKKAEGTRMFHGVKHSSLAWKRMALPDEILMRKAIRGIRKEETIWTPRSERTNHIKKHFPDATDDQIQSARIVAEKHIARNTKLSITHTRKTLEIHAKNPQQIKRYKKS